MYEKQINTVSKICLKVLGKNKINTIFEIGARDGSETLAFNSIFPESEIYSFECNPSTIEIWKNKIKDIKNIKFREIAISDKVGSIDFYQIDQEKTETTWSDGNPGASSLLQSSNNYEVEKYVQNKITVSTDKLSNVLNQEKIDSVDLLWIDIQGAELMAFKGAEERIKDIKIIHTEVEFFEIYKNQPLFTDIKKYLNSKNFSLCYFTSFGKYSGDAVFINNDIIKNKSFSYIKYLIKDKTLYTYKKIFFTLRKFLVFLIKR